MSGMCVCVLVRYCDLRNFGCWHDVILEVWDSSKNAIYKEEELKQEQKQEIWRRSVGTDWKHSESM